MYKCTKHSVHMMGTIAMKGSNLFAVSLIRPFFEEITIKPSLTKSTIGKDTRMFADI